MSTGVAQITGIKVSAVQRYCWFRFLTQHTWLLPGRPTHQKRLLFCQKYTGGCPNKNSFPWSPDYVGIKKRFRPSEKGFGQRPAGSFRIILQARLHRGVLSIHHLVSFAHFLHTSCVFFLTFRKDPCFIIFCVLGLRSAF